MTLSVKADILVLVFLMYIVNTTLICYTIEAYTSILITTFEVYLSN